MTAAGGDDAVVIAGAGARVSAGGGDDNVTDYADRAAATIGLGAGDDTMVLAAGTDVDVTGGPGDDIFRIKTHGDDEDDPAATVPITGTLRGQSDDDTLTWDCKSTVDVTRQLLGCTHRPATIAFSGMQVYRASDEWPWKDIFRGGPHRDIFYGGGRDDTMIGGRGDDKLIGGSGHDTADGGPGTDVCQAEVIRNC